VTDQPSDRIVGLPAPLSELPWSADFVMQAIEILAVAFSDAGITYMKPEHADSFVVGWPAGEKPEIVAARTVERLGLRPLILHSTSWRHSDDEVVLTYIAVVDDATSTPESFVAVPVGRAELARGDATAPPPAIGVEQVLEHALRHVAWLVRDDPVVHDELETWITLLDGYVPEPFRSFGPPV
jgi:hypothetical protein